MTIGTVVKGKVCGTFLVLGLRTIGGEQYAQVKEMNVETGTLYRGEFALPVSDLISQ